MSDEEEFEENDDSMPQEARQNCQVCARPNGITNFGAIACRACGAFFRRSMTLLRNFECNCKNRLPKTFSERILSCKGCRLKRCFEAGMKKELVRAITLRSFHEKRRNDIQDKEENDEQETILPVLPGSEGPIKAGIAESMMQISQKARLIWFSAMPIPTQFWDCTLEDLLRNHSNLLARHQEFARMPSRKCNRWACLERIQKYGLCDSNDRSEEIWRDFQGRVNQYVRDILICIGMARTMPAIEMLDLQDQVLQVENCSSIQKVIQMRSTVPMATHLLLPFFSFELSTEMMMFPNGVGAFEVFDAASKFYGDKSIGQLAHKVFISPMGMHRKFMLRKYEYMLLMYMLLSTPAACSELSEKARNMLGEESEKYGKMLLRFQQHHIGEQAGALRYMESQQLVWNAIECAQKYRELMDYIDCVLHKGAFKMNSKLVDSILYGTSSA